MRAYKYIPKKGPTKHILHMTYAESSALSRAIYKAIGWDGEFGWDKSKRLIGLKDANIVASIADELDTL